MKWHRFIHNFKTSLDPMQYLTQAKSLFRIKEWQESSPRAPCRVFSNIFILCSYVATGPTSSGSTAYVQVNALLCIILKLTLPRVVVTSNCRPQVSNSLEIIFEVPTCNNSQ